MLLLAELIFFGFDCLAGDFTKFFDEFDAADQTEFGFVAQGFEAFAEVFELSKFN